MTDVITEVMSKLLRRSLHREEKEVYAAWRAGYNYLHVIDHIKHESFEYHREYIPHNYMMPSTTHNARIYDLREERMSPEERKLLREHSP